MDATQTKQANEMLSNMLRRKALDWCDNAIKALESQVAELKRRRADLETCEDVQAHIPGAQWRAIQAGLQAHNEAHDAFWANYLPQADAWLHA